MIRIEYDMKMPESCAECPLIDDEFYYRHGHIEYKSWEVEDIYKCDKTRPE